MNYVGIDPGQKGALGCVNDSGEIVFYKTFIDHKTAGDWLEELKPKLVNIEKLWVIPPAAKKHNFTLGINYGRWLQLIEDMELPSLNTPAVTWQKAILNTAHRNKKDTGILSIAYVNKRFPGLNLSMKTKSAIDINSGIADSICLALFARREDLLIKE